MRSCRSLSTPAGVFRVAGKPYGGNSGGMTQDKQTGYRPVVFRDRSAGYAFLTRSTASSDQTIEWDDGEKFERRFGDGA